MRCQLPAIHTSCKSKIDFPATEPSASLRAAAFRIGETPGPER
jgi:hypothetical protein